MGIARYHVFGCRNIYLLRATLCMGLETFALVLVNLQIIPTSAPLFDDVVWGFAVPIAIPLLLLQANMRKIWKETGRMFFIFLIGSVGTVVGALLGYAVLGSYVPDLNSVAAMITGSYIGGGVNFTALADAFKVKGTVISATVVADNLNMAIYFLILIAVAGNAFFRKYYTHPHIDDVAVNGKSEDGETLAAKYWGRKEISLKDIALNLMYAVIVVAVSKAIAAFFGTVVPKDTGILQMCNTFFGSQYVWITLLAMCFATFCHKQVASMNGSQEIGTYFIYLFFFVIGVPASISEIIQNAPLLLVFCLIVVLVNMAFCFVFGKLFKFDLYRRTYDGGRHGNFSRMVPSCRAVYARRHFRLCYRYVFGYYCRQYAWTLRYDRGDDRWRMFLTDIRIYCVMLRSIERQEKPVFFRIIMHNGWLKAI